MLKRFHFHRFEFKYLLTLSQAEAIEEELRPHMQPDPYAIDQEKGIYRVRSLYFDSDTFRMYEEKLAGMKTRRKFRIRTYVASPEEDEKVYLEIKRRKNSIIIKDRAFVPYNLVAGGKFQNVYNLIKNEEMPKPRRDTLEEFLFHIYRLHMRPQVLITYDRQPLVGKTHKSVRVTFDREIRALATKTLYDKTYGKAVLPSCVVFEVKFSGSIPWWLRRIIQGYNLRHQAISKYCLGVDATGLVKTEFV